MGWPLKRCVRPPRTAVQAPERNYQDLVASITADLGRRGECFSLGRPEQAAIKAKIDLFASGNVRGIYYQIEEQVQVAAIRPPYPEAAKEFLLAALKS